MLGDRNVKDQHCKTHKEITIIEIAEMAGVSQATVGRVIGGYGSVSRATREKVEKIIKEVGYMPNAIAQSMKRKNTNTIGVVLGHIGNPFFGEVVQSIESICMQAGYNVIICNTGENIEVEVAAIKTLYSRKIDGLILSTAQASDVSLNDLDKELYTGWLPIIYIDREISSVNELCVKSDHCRGAYDATKYLIGKGHTKIGVVAGIQTSTIAERVSGYRQALHDSGIPFRPEYVGFSDVDVTSIEEGRKFVADLIGKNKEITAIFSLNNFLSMGARMALYDLNIKIPDDLSFVGWDDFMLADVMDPPLTMVAQATGQIGRLAAEKLLEQIRLEKPDDLFSEKSITLNTRLIERASCGPPKE